MPLMSLREYSRHRGVSLAAVQKAIASGRIIVAKETQQGSKTLKFLDSALADRMWNERTDPVQQRVATRGEMGKEEKVDPTHGDQQNLFPETPSAGSGVGGQSKNSQGTYGDLYNKARSVKETFNAKIVELEYKEKVGDLADKNELARILFNIAANIQQNILNVPSQIVPLIHARCLAFKEEFLLNPQAELNVKEIDDIITGELKIALEGISNGIVLN